MLKISTESTWYRPYVVIASGTTYEVKGIKVYDKETQTLIIDNCFGWFENKYHQDITSFELPTVDTLKRKTKVDYNSKVPYVISLGKPDFGTRSECILYIPADLLNIQLIETGVSPYDTFIYKVYEGNCGIYIRQQSEKIENKIDDLRTITQALLTQIQDKSCFTSLNMPKDSDIEFLINTTQELVEKFKDLKKETNRIKEEKANYNTLVKY